MRYFAVLMAAGFSSRFGTANKLLALFRGKPMACHTLSLVCGMGCFERIFFVYADEAVGNLARASMMAHFPVTMVHNPAPEKGQGESVRLGVMAADAFLTATDVQAPAESASYFFLPCDQPLLDAGTARLLLDAARPGYIVEPRCPDSRNCRASPSVFSVSFRDELLAMSPGEQPRLIKSRHQDLVISVEVPDPAVLADVDTLTDLARLRNNSNSNII